MFRHILLSILLCLPLLTLANDDRIGRISGSIKTHEGYPVAFANIYLEGPNRSTYTNDRGEFSLTNIAAGEYMLKISSIGFMSIRQNVMIEADKELKLEFIFEEDVTTMPQVTIIASRDRLFTKTPGSVAFVNSKELKLLNPLSANEALRRVAGVHVVDEELAGMRVNIGIRGLNPDRSRSVLILEDGVPVALNPYGEPEMYYSPSIDRMAGLEVLKGSGQVLYGPQTIGGVINYVTADPSEEQSFQARLTGGEGGFFTGLLNYGNTVGNTGIQVNFLRRQADNLGMLDFTVNDFNAKLKQIFSERSVLGVKLGAYMEQSNATYVGLTQPMWDEGGQDFVRLAPDDLLAVNRYSVSFHHDYTINPAIKLRSLAFAYTTTRNWRRQDFSSSPSASNQSGVIWGNRDIPGGALFMQQGNGHRNRQFEVAGFEQRLESSYYIGSKASELVAGYRMMHERAYEQRINGTRPWAKSGALVSDEIRGGTAVSLFAQNKVKATEKLTLSGGLRAEFFNFEREIIRNPFGGVVRDTSIINSNTIAGLIPGAGFTYQMNPNFAWFGGLHVGFAPPRVKDAITAVGEVLDLDAESSINYELGFRTTALRGVFFELTAFYMDFANQIIPVSESSGGTGAGLVNSGRSMHAGVETAMSFDLGSLFSTRHQWEFDINATFVHTEFSEDRFKTVNGQLVNIRGNRLPYAPNTFLSSGLTWQAPSGFGARFTGTYVSRQFGDELNTVVPEANGRVGEIPAYFLLDGNVFYQIKGTQTTLTLSGKNLLDHRYIASRRPQGIRPGLPRFITAGVDIRF
jgi:Fe(3+) dicitrate transport protein